MNMHGIEWKHEPAKHPEIDLESYTDAELVFQILVHPANSPTFECTCPRDYRDLQHVVLIDDVTREKRYWFEVELAKEWAEQRNLERMGVAPV